MQKQEFLNEEEYQRNNAKVKKIGKIIIIIGVCLLVLGVIFTLIGIIGFGGEIVSGFELGQDGINPGGFFGGIFGGIGLFALGGTMTISGIFVTVVGLIVRFFIGNRREITAYTTQQVMPLAQEGIDKMAPTIGNAAKEITKGIKEGLKDEE